MTSLCVPGDSEGDEEETTQDEISSHTSEEDGGVVKVEKELENAEQPVGGNEVVEHEASDKWLLSLGSPLPFSSALIPHPQIIDSTSYPNLRCTILTTPSCPFLLTYHYTHV